jgi:hypothetical protein
VAETPTLTPGEFKRGYRAFEARESRDAMYKTAMFLVEHFWGQAKDMADGMGVLLLTWNQAFYRYGSFDFALLEDVLRGNMPTINQLRPRDIQSLQASDEPAIERLFMSFLDALRIKEGKKKDCRSPVAVAKALHLLAPRFLPIWDDKIARAYACYYDQKPGQKYVAFAHKMKALGLRLQEHVPPDSDRTFLKLIDEFNYAKHTKGWI